MSDDRDYHNPGCINVVALGAALAATAMALWRRMRG